jgi:hypothetical protein
MNLLAGRKCELLFFGLRLLLLHFVHVQILMLQSTIEKKFVA